MKNIINGKSKCAVIGYGSWGTAIAKILLENCDEIGWWVRNKDVQNSIRTKGVNSRYLSEVHFPKNKTINVSGDINEIVKNYDILIFAVPSAYLKGMLEDLTISLDGKMVISAIKGIVTNKQGDYITITEYFNSVWGVEYGRLGIITGPCHAEEIALERLTYLNVVCKHFEVAEVLKEKFTCDYMRVNCMTDIYGAEYGAVLKNIFALSVGICKGMGYGDNFIAVLIANASSEMERFLDKTYPCDRELKSSAYVGDLLVTSYSQFSRNRRFGMMIGQGHTPQSAIIELNNMVAEGYNATMCINKINEKWRVEMPIANFAYSVLYERTNLQIAIKELITQLR